MFWLSGPVGRSSTTVPTAVPPSLPSSQTVCTAMTRLVVSSVVGSFCSVDCATSCRQPAAPGVPWRTTMSPCSLRMSNSSPWRAAVTSAADSAGSSTSWSPSRASARPAIEAALRAVSSTNESRSCAMAPSASGTTAATRIARVSASSAAATRLVMRTPFFLSWPRALEPQQYQKERSSSVHTGALVSRGRAVSQPEAVAVHGLDERGVAELAPQRREVHVKHFGRPVPVLVPGPLDDLLPADKAPGIGSEALEDRELLGRQRHLVAPHRHLAGAQVDGERPVPQHLGGAGTTARPLAAPEDGTDPGEQFGEPERLDQGVVGPFVGREHTVRFLAARGHHEDRSVRVGAEPAAHVDAVHVGQP